MLKRLIKKILFVLHIDVTRNQQYDRQTINVLRKILLGAGNCIDIGCHKGEIMDLMLKFSPHGNHFGFVPIPNLFMNLKEKYKYNRKVKIYDYALSDETGNTTFNYVVNAPAYGGIKQTHYDRKDAKVEIINVKLEKLDAIIPPETKISLIKIDTEGAINTIKKNKPFIIFEFGLGASDYYNTKPDDMFMLFTEEFGLKISLLKSWLKNEPELTKENSSKEYFKSSNYYFLAHPK